MNCFATFLFCFLISYPFSWDLNWWRFSEYDFSTFHTDINTRCIWRTFGTYYLNAYSRSLTSFLSTLFERNLHVLSMRRTNLIVPHWNARQNTSDDSVLYLVILCVNVLMTSIIYFRRLFKPCITFQSSFGFWSVKVI